MSVLALWFKYDLRLLTRTDIDHRAVRARIARNAARLIAGDYQEGDTGINAGEIVHPYIRGL